MRQMPFRKYRAYPVFDLPDRKWPGRVITGAPRWCSVDLRDGNQALSVPMDEARKMRMFRLLTGLGFKEIEVAFPAASETEYRFVRELIEGGHIPEGVTIQVLTQAREHLIAKTMESLRGCPKAVVHVYNSTSLRQREVVFRMSRKEVMALAVRAAGMVKQACKSLEGTEIHFEYSPESFTGTEPDFAVEICSAVIAAWDPTSTRKMIINLPATVEMSTPNVYADRIEWFCGRIPRRDQLVISVHTHNDRGTAVAAAELAVLAGAERVEGALFGNGERSGNMDILTMALNLFSQGIDPELDFSDINRVIEEYRNCTGMPVHPRHPYAGELVHTAFSGSHQDAISKGMKARGTAVPGVWEVPYLPVDPQDLGRSYEAIIRVNSQSGKGGAAFVLETQYGVILPKWMQADFGAAVKEVADQTGCELSPERIYICFWDRYVIPGRKTLGYCHVESDTSGKENAGNRSMIRAGFEAGKRRFELVSEGNGPLDALVKGLRKEGINIEIQNYSEYALSAGSESKAAAFIHTKDSNGREAYGVGIDESISIASIQALASALNQISND